MPAQQQKTSTVKVATKKSNPKLIISLMLLQMGGLFCWGHIEGLLIAKEHGPVSTYVLTSSLISATGGFVICIAGLLTLLRQRQIAAWMLILAALLQIVSGILAIANPVWEGKPYLGAWLNAGLGLLLATIFLLVSRWLRWQEDTDD